MKKNVSKKSLRIAIFCATEFSIPPTPAMKDIYAPLWLTYYIAEVLKKRGHRVTLFAGSDSKTGAKLVSDGLISLAENKKLSRFYQPLSKLRRENFYQQLLDRKGIIEEYDYLLLSRMYREVLKKKFDIVYINLIGLRPLPLAALSETPTVFTLNAPLSPFYGYVFSEFKKRYPQFHFIGISRNQVVSAPKLFRKIIYNGIDLRKFSFNSKPKKYLLTAGRIAESKGIYEAIQVAKRLKEKLIIVGRHTEDEYWHTKIKPNLGKNIRYLGLLPYPKVASIYRNAKAFLFPIKWEEPFGLVMTESMACGTPVIAFNRGSVPEVIVDGKTGFIVDTVEEMVKAVKKIDLIDRSDCRAHVEKKFSVEQMVDDYEKEFLKLV
ncbi:MAG: hypothetical protein A3G49_04675 [Candidatus Sungbacteria bacterium RIFCSPLOWO2_12_FULL_41_11]|uniref:Glycosyl transferase family 1 domain-containing protein n=1 Tax=Candidatus Sungbacteria bacterium RIFCSPLOWO2_12_FULL_41_11 TaxID=1802286 RepID=A0A1G2LNE1_9BACT|nr:MAG: Glycosyltransferase [Parcubacteria group bacterium GW2011_GWA2_42_14]OHA13126.1 MAG: hypothetical protein A3G49_04675 [Candidatus Sungbacteria bacterium RIFCSPLOWO2_12_FULL_41_11]